MKATKQTASAVRRVLDQFVDAYNARDIDTMLSLYPHDQSLVAVTAGPEEPARNLDDARVLFARDFTMANSSALHLTNLIIAEAESCAVAWVYATARLLLHIDGHAVEVNGPYTAVLERVDGRWCIMQSHFSLPVARDAMGQMLSRVA